MRLNIEGGGSLHFWYPPVPPFILTKKVTPTMAVDFPKTFPPQKQPDNPGDEFKMNPEPIYIREDYRGADKLKGQKALITGGDSGIGRAVSVHFAREGADVAIVYLEEDRDAQKTKQLVEAEGQRCILIRGDHSDSNFCRAAVEQTVDQLGGLDILVNNAAWQTVQEAIEDIDDAQFDRTMKSNVYGYFYMTRAAIKHLPDTGKIICTTSVNSYKGNEMLIDYSTTKGANTAFLRSMALNLASRGIRVNGVAPGPIWTPFIPGGFDDAAKITAFGQQTNLGRAGQPCECATAFVFLASDDSSYFTGQVLHPNGGSIVGA